MPLQMDEIGQAATQNDLTTLLQAHEEGVELLGSERPEDLTTLHWASGGGAANVVLWLIRVCGADVHAARRNNFFPLHTAAMQGHAEVVRILLAAGASPDVQTDPQGYAPLHSAAWAGHLETVQALLAGGADRTLRNYRSETPAETAHRQGQGAVANLLDGVGGPRVEEIAWGRLTLETGEQFRDAKLWPGGAREWDWKETGTRHRPGIQLADVQELLDQGCDVVVLSRGQRLVLQTAPDVLAALRNSGIEVLHLESREAVQAYNRLVADGRRVGALIHSTC